MTTRLDRLFLLLETGSTSVIRKSAAEQLGEVQKLHPHELKNLLTKIHGYLGHNNWDTRVAATQAVEAIVRHVPQWAPSVFSENECEVKSENFSTEGRLHLHDFSIEKVLLNGLSLLASEGSEYDVEEVPGIDSREKLIQQRQLLNKRLGLDLAPGLGVDIGELFKDEDLMPEATQLSGSSAVLQQSVANLLNQQAGNASEIKMSARELQQEKRKAKFLARQLSESKLQSSNGSPVGEGPPVKVRRTCSVVVDTQNDHKVVIDNSIVKSPNIDEQTEWPFEIFCDQLMADLFDSSWEKRHGAAMALREIIRLHGKGAAVNVNASLEQRESCHQLWMEDIAVRLLSVMALDRFGDFVSDEVVAPVRESCAQTLGVVTSWMSFEHVLSVVKVLIEFVQQTTWEVHHAGLLGIKYILAVRQDNIEKLLPIVIDSIQSGFKDKDDDVRAVSAAALIPVVDHLVRLIPEEVPLIIVNLWNCLLDLDDLTASTASIMALLASLVSHPGLDIDKLECGEGMTKLVPRLWPFLSHNVSIVRKSALNTLQSLLAKRSKLQNAVWCTPTLLSEGLRHVYQRTVLEEREDMLDFVYKAWCAMVDGSVIENLVPASLPYVGIWLCLAMQPAKIAIDPNMLIRAKHSPRDGLLQQSAEDSKAAPSESWDKSEFIGGLVPSSDADHSERVFKSRLVASRCLGFLLVTITSSFSSIPQDSHGANNLPPENFILDSLSNIFVFHLNSLSATQRLTAALVIIEWATMQQPCRCPQSVMQRLHQCLSDVVYYDEISHLFASMQTECRNFLAGLRQFGIDLSDTFSNSGLLTTEQAQKLCGEVYDGVRNRIPYRSAAMVDERRTALQSTVHQTAAEFETSNLRVQTCIACSVVSLGCLPEKMNPVVRPLMDSVRKEQIFSLQSLAGQAIALLVSLCVNRSPNPMPKVVKNLSGMLSAASEAVKLISEITSESNEDHLKSTPTVGILTLNRQQSCVVNKSRTANGKKTLKSTGDCEIADASRLNDNENEACNDIQQRGAKLALTQVTKNCGEKLSQLLPSLLDLVSQPLNKLKDRIAESENGFVDSLTNSLQLLEVIGPSINAFYYPMLLDLKPSLLGCLKFNHTVVRHLASRCIATLSRVLVAEIMAFVYEDVLPLFGAIDSEITRQGGMECVANVISVLGINILPYVVLLIVPILGRMSDQNEAVRLMATQCFADLIRLLPLESAVSDTVILNDCMAKQRETERKFLEQLLDSSKIENYKLPVPVNAELRKYQQDGVNWLAFLNKYNLNGILCDDMGLGKTLQTLCILVGDHVTRTKLLETAEVGSIQLPSLVVCPPTLTGHWAYEVDKFVSKQHLSVLLYTGPPAERNRLQRLVDKHNLVVASYDVVRNDIAFFSAIKWNYCILDEGHVIRNGKTKLAKSIKQLISNHRLILSGTPIQNNVLDLWSLFDFLMPGFLGTEKQFQSRFGRPILQSRDAKSSSVQQETGALAMEALHRQVLPFILRRLKEDVLSDLPPKIIQDYYCDLSPLQIQLYEDFAKSRAKKTVDEDVHTAEEEDEEKLVISGTSHIFQALQYLRKLCNHPALVLNNKHPQYNRVVTDLQNKQSSIRDIAHAPKLAALKQLLIDCGMGRSSDGGNNGSEPIVSEHRALIFCQLKSMLDIIEQDVLKSQMPGVTYLRLDGSVPAGSRQDLVNRFNDDPSIDLLLLTTHVGGLGLNLTGADTVIFVEHDWNPMKDLQAMDRAHRIGQKKVVNVYRLITTGTLEEKIMGLHKFKLSIANTVISQDNASLATMGTDQLLDLFTLNTQSKEESAKKRDEKKGGLKAVLESMEELWDERQYENEYSMDMFLQSLTNK